MNAVAARRKPLGCLKTALRQARQHNQRAPIRWLATAAVDMTDASSSSGSDSKSLPKGVYTTRQRMWKQKLSKFEIWPQTSTQHNPHPEPLRALAQRQIAELDPTGTRTRLFSREHDDSAKVGDVVMVTTTTGEPFSGVFLQMRRAGVDTAIQLRAQLMRTSIEMWFKIYSPSVTGIDIVWRRPRRARRARLTYLRKPKHDMGSVEQLVMKWRKERYALTNKARARAEQAAARPKGR